MEGFAVLIGLGLVGFIFIAPIIALVRAYSAGRQAEKNQENWQKLTQRVHALETELQELHGRLKEQTFTLEQATYEPRKASAVREGPAPAAVAPPEPRKPPVVAAGLEAHPLEPPRPAATLIPPVPALTPPPAPAAIAKPILPPASIAPPALLPIENPAVPAPPTVPPHSEILRAHPPISQETAKRVLNMEEVLGTDWLNKLGMSILVIGVALFLAYEMRELGPAGKVLVGFVVSGVFLGAGIFYERRERYRLLARVAIGGGWALTFFTTYAMYHVAGGAGFELAASRPGFAAGRRGGDGCAHLALQLAGGHRPGAAARLHHGHHQQGQCLQPFRRRHSGARARHHRAAAPMV